MNSPHHPTVGSPKTRLAQAKDFAREWWKQAVCVAVIAGSAMVITGWDRTCDPLPNFAAIKDTDERKAAFIDHLAPMVERANREVAGLRTRLLAINTALVGGMAPGARQLDFVRAAASQYGLGDVTEVDRALMVRLLERVDTLPVSLVVAQAAIESGWGTSRFAQKGNNLFGMHDYSGSGGLVPKERSSGSYFELMVFTDTCDAVRAYMLNLNVDSRYQELRTLRGQLRAKGVLVTGTRLADGLHHYSSRGDEYVEDVKGLIATNKLERLDTDDD